MPHLAAILLRPRAGARIRLVSHDELVHQRLVEFAREQRVGRVDRRGSALLVDEFEFHGAPLTS
jgi:hypothetical protein